MRKDGIVRPGEIVRVKTIGRTSTRDRPGALAGPGRLVRVFGRVRVTMLVGVAGIVRVLVGRSTALPRNRGWMPLFEPEARGRHARAEHAIRPQLVIREPEAAERGAQFLERKPRIQTGAEDHVA